MFILLLLKIKKSKQKFHWQNLTKLSNYDMLKLNQNYKEFLIKQIFQNKYKTNLMRFFGVSFAEKQLDLL